MQARAHSVVLVFTELVVVSWTEGVTIANTLIERGV